MLSKLLKEWDKIRQVWKDEPFKDKYAHGADAIRYMVKDSIVYDEKHRTLKGKDFYTPPTDGGMDI